MWVNNWETLDKKQDRLKILTDTREQLPLWKDNKVTLNTGDYTTSKLHGYFHIERKSPGDLYGTLLKGHSRFRREIFRARDREVTLSVYIECSEKNFYAKKWPGGNFCKFPGETIEKCINTMRKKYKLEFNFCTSRLACKKAIHKRLLNEEKLHRLNGKRKVNQSAPRS